MKERLQQLLNVLGYTATRFADEIDVQRSGISHILSGRNQPSFDFLVKILNKYKNLSAEWLILGKGDMFKDRYEAKKTDSKVTPEYIPAAQQHLFNQPVTNNPHPENSEVTEVNNTKVTTVTPIKQVLLLHDDGSFEVYNHSKKD